MPRRSGLTASQFPRSGKYLHPMLHGEEADGDDSSGEWSINWSEGEESQSD